MTVQIHRYRCPSELAPMLEGALAANGYTIEIRYENVTPSGYGKTSNAAGRGLIGMGQIAQAASQ
jgi:hypothetical protein